MSNIKTINIDGSIITYKEFGGLEESRYDISANIEDKWFNFTIVCIPSLFREKLEEMIEIYKSTEKRRKGN